MILLAIASVRGCVLLFVYVNQVAVGENVL